MSVIPFSQNFPPELDAKICSYLDRRSLAQTMRSCRNINSNEVIQRQRDLFKELFWTMQEQGFSDEMIHLFEEHSICILNLPELTTTENMLEQHTGRPTNISIEDMTSPVMRFKFNHLAGVALRIDFIHENTRGEARYTQVLAIYNWYGRHCFAAKTELHSALFTLFETLRLGHGIEVARAFLSRANNTGEAILPRIDGKIEQRQYEGPLIKQDLVKARLEAQLQADLEMERELHAEGPREENFFEFEVDQAEEINEISLLTKVQRILLGFILFLKNMIFGS